MFWTNLCHFSWNWYSCILLFCSDMQLAEVKVQILEAKQTLEDCIAAQEFSRAAELKESITRLEESRNQILQDIAESSQPTDKEPRAEKVQWDPGCVILVLSWNWCLKTFFLNAYFPQNDPETLLRCLTMCAELMKQMNIKTRTGPTISALMSSLVKLFLIFTSLNASLLIDLTAFFISSSNNIFFSYEASFVQCHFANKTV